MSKGLSTEGARILVVEDEYLLAMDVVNALQIWAPK